SFRCSGCRWRAPPGTLSSRRPRSRFVRSPRGCGHWPRREHYIMEAPRRMIMRRWTLLGALSLALTLSSRVAQPQGVARLYIIDCGHNAAVDQSRWSPGVNVGKPIEFSDNCYLIRHGADWMLWDTGYPDAVAAGPVTTPVGTATRAKTLAAQL